MRYSWYFLNHPNVGRLCWLLLLPVVGLMIAMHTVLAGADIVALQMAFSHERFINVLNSYSALQLDGVRLHFAFDNLYPVFYALFFSALVTYRIRCVPSLIGFRFVIRLPLVAGLADLIENACLVPFAANLADTPEHLIFLMSSAALVKWICLAMVLIFLFFSFSPGLRQRAA